MQWLVACLFSQLCFQIQFFPFACPFFPLTLPSITTRLPSSLKALMRLVHANTTAAVNFSLKGNETWKKLE